ncbi:MAG TPA: dienelactone hydrolase family protein [Acidimicrobiales bacterium]|nr:dienelactone hydrolase family protein [Acidimicrobiales bacterium]
MGEMIEFPSNGTTGHGYLATPPSGSGPGVVVIQEWWGLVPHIEDLCDRFAAEGFVALAPDLYHGQKTTEPDEAQKLMMAMQIDKAAKDMSGAVDTLAARSQGEGVGVVGFCMGGGLALILAARRGDKVRAVVPFYGVVAWPDVELDYTKLTGAVLGHFAEHDDMATPERVRELEASLRAAGNEDVAMHIYAGTEHAFFNDTRPEVYSPEAAERSWTRTIEFLRSRLSG